MSGLIEQKSAKVEARPKRAHQSCSKIKVMMTVFFDLCGVVHYEFLPPRQTVNKQYYLGVMHRLREAIRLKRPELWANNYWFLHHDNAAFHECSRSSCPFPQKFHAHRSASTVFV